MSQNDLDNLCFRDEDVQTDDLLVVGEGDDIVVVDIVVVGEDDDVDILVVVVDVRVVDVVMELTSSYHLTLDDFQFDSEHSGNRTRNIFVCSIRNISTFDSDNYDATFGPIVELFGLFVEAFVLDIEIFGRFAEAFGHEIATLGLFVETFGTEIVTFGLNDQTFGLEIETSWLKIATVEQIWTFGFVDPDNQFDKFYFD